MTSKDPIVDKIIVARVGLLLRHPFFGNMATRMKIVEASDWCPTAATDFRNLYFNRKFFESMTARQIEFVIAHEILHCAFDHLMRKEGRDANLWNIAADYCVNGVLVRDKIGDMPPVNCFHDTQYYGKGAEEIYDILYKKAKKIDINTLGELLDEHLEGEEEGGGKNGDKDDRGRPRLSKEEKQQIRDEIKEAMIQAANAAAGNTPSEIKRMIKELTEPKMNWRELLRMQLQSTIKTDFTWMRPSRRGWDMDAVMPGMRNEDAIDIAVFIDASGSIGDKMLKDFLGEIQGIMESFESYKIHVVTFDTRCYNPVTYDSDNLDSICDYDVSGGGGTDFECIFDYLKEDNIEPKKLVVFTDGMPFGSWGDPNYCDTVWIIHSNPGCTAPFGISAEYDKQDKH